MRILKLQYFVVVRGVATAYLPFR